MNRAKSSNNFTSLDAEIRGYLHSLKMETSDHFLGWPQRRQMRKGVRGYVSVIESKVEPSWWNFLAPDVEQYNHIEHQIGKLQYTYSREKQEPWLMHIYSVRYLSPLVAVADELGSKYQVEMYIRFCSKKLKTNIWKEFRENKEDYINGVE